MYGLGCLGVLIGQFDFVHDTFRAMLTTSGYVIDVNAIDTHQFRDDVTNEVIGSGYTTGGVGLVGVSCQYDTVSNEVRIDFNDPSWGPTANFTARNMIVYQVTGAAGNDSLVMWVDFGGDEMVTNGTFLYSVPPTGALAFTVL